MESTRTRHTRLLFCTTGILLRMLQDGGSALASVSHIIVDEAHERDVLTDFLLIILRDLVRARPSLRVLIMSATMDAQRFADYFGTDAVFQVPGRTFPVTDLYLEDALELTGHVIPDGHPCALAQAGGGGGGRQRMSISGKRGTAATVVASWDDLGETTSELYDECLYAGYKDTTKRSLRRVDEARINVDLVLDLLSLIGAGGGEGGAVLVFLPGLGEISHIFDALMASAEFSDARRWLVVAAHSALSAADQRRIFVRPPAGVRKVVLATNIAETSMTIDDVSIVIDTGRVKETRYVHQHKMRALVECWVDQAAARQRAGGSPCVSMYV